MTKIELASIEVYIHIYRYSIQTITIYIRVDGAHHPEKVVRVGKGKPPLPYGYIQTPKRP